MSPSEAIALLSPAWSKNHRTGNVGVEKSSAPTRWADLGCGSGLFTLALTSFLPPGSKVYAIDRQPKIHTQTTPNQVSIERTKADFVEETLSVQDLDGILMANSLHYVKDKLALIRTLQSTNLRSEHAFLIVEYDTDRPIQPWVPYPMSFLAAAELFKGAGYTTITRLADHPSVYNRSTMYSAFVS